MNKVLIGLDIGNQYIKAAQVSRDKNKNTLLAAGYIATPVTAIALTGQNDTKLIADSINRLIHDMKVTTLDVSASLPSSKVVTRVITIPEMKESELSGSLEWEAEQFIPWPLAKVKLDYSIIDHDINTKRMTVLLVAAPISLIEKYMQIISSAGLNLISLETEILATARSISNTFPQLSNILVFSFGATTNEIAILHNQIMVYNKSYPLGGNTLTKAIAEELGFDILQAEEYKKTYGLDENKLEGKIAKIINPFFTTIFSEIEKTVSYFKEHYPKEELTTIILTGGAVKLPGLVLSVTKGLGLDSQIINPFININVDEKILPVITPDASLYTTSIGLSLKDV